MVLLASTLGNVINNLIKSSNTYRETIHCSNYNNLSVVNIPNWNGTVGIEQVAVTSDMTDATGTTVYVANYAIVYSLGTSGPPGAATGTFQRLCVNWYGEDYPYWSIYEVDPLVSSKARVRDSAYTAEPIGGWFNATTTGIVSGLVELKTATKFANWQLRTWAVHGTSDTTNYVPLIGTKGPGSSLSFASFATSANGPAFASLLSNSSLGILGTIPTRYWMDSSNPFLPTFLPVPWYNFSGTTTDAIDDAISTALNLVITNIAKVDKTILLSSPTSANQTQLLQLYQTLNTILNDLPHAG